MPYKSEAQRKFFNSEAGKEKLGEAEVEHWNKESEGMKLPNKVKDTLDKAIKTCDAGTEVIKSKNGYTLGRNNGKLVIAFTYKGETLNNPHMWLGVENSSNMSKAEELFENLAKTRSGKTKDADKPSLVSKRNSLQR